MNNEKLIADLKTAKEARSAAMAKVKDAKDNNELDKIEVEIRKAELTINDVSEQLNNAGIDIETGLPAEARPESSRSKGKTTTGKMIPIASYRSGEKAESEEDMYSTVEYRNAFKDFVVKGTPIPEKFAEKREASLTTVSDIGAVIPTTILNKVIEDLTVEGKIISRITQTSYQGGVEIPISEIDITATWVASENTVSDEQKAKMDAKLSFAYHVLEARVSVGLLSATVALPIFESTMVNQLKKAITRAIETAIISGTGSGQPLGITKYSLPNKNIIEMTADEIGTVTAWAGVEAAIPEAYEDSVIYMMSKATWELYLNGMVDKNGQRIGLGKINEKGQKILNGREVLTVDKFPSFVSAANGDIFAVVVDLSKYCLNSNLAMYYKKYFDEDKNKWVHKALTIVDGKMAIGTTSAGKLINAGSLLYIKKKVAS
ncbi:MAG: phage major capsid protein [Clostridia bacterium]|jgi:HK97 family phage major capsid protein|nr:phage major capsid protein [Clostridia bacterium]